jgi:1-aminocyclopropane-1-carboxylate deaminase/D-cysteine desulfhydrase-like pyridoxal-dependent ACC family enzyme
MRFRFNPCAVAAFTWLMRGVPYVIPSGASDHPLGGLGYVRCALEILQQSEENGLQFSASSMRQAAAVLKRA